MADAQQVNSLERFRKRPGRLVLEEFSHCEVPAGCGGVVLRWRNPWAALPVTIYLYTPVRATCWLDGSEMQTARVDLAPGRHVAGFMLDNVDLSAGLIMFAGTFDPGRSRGTLPGAVTERPLKILTQDDGTWRFNLHRPATDDWLTLSFDDRDWPALVRVPTPQPGNQDFGFYQCRMCAHLGTACLGLPPPAPDEGGTSWWQQLLTQLGARPAPAAPEGVWMRKVFEIPLPEVRDQHS